MQGEEVYLFQVPPRYFGKCTDTENYVLRNYQILNQVENQVWAQETLKIDVLLGTNHQVGLLSYLQQP